MPLCASLTHKKESQVSWLSQISAGDSRFYNFCVVVCRFWCFPLFYWCGVFTFFLAVVSFWHTLTFSLCDLDSFLLL